MSPRVQKQIQRIRAKAKIELPEPIDTAKAEWPSFAEPAVDNNGAHLDNLMSPTAPENPSGQPTISIEEMQLQLKVKDVVITELASIVELLEVNYGISIDDKTKTFQTLMNIAHSMKKEAGTATSSTMPEGKHPRHRTSIKEANPRPQSAPLIFQLLHPGLLSTATRLPTTTASSPPWRAFGTWSRWRMRPWRSPTLGSRCSVGSWRGSRLRNCCLVGGLSGEMGLVRSFDCCLHLISSFS